MKEVLMRDRIFMPYEDEMDKPETMSSMLEDGLVDRCLDAEYEQPRKYVNRSNVYDGKKRDTFQS